MTEGLMPGAVLAALKPEAVVPAMLVLVSQDAPTRTTFCAGAGHVEVAHITMTQGTWIGLDEQAPERLAAQLQQACDRTGDMVPANGSAQGAHEVARATAHLSPH
jgi:hypothetical protein